MSKRTTINLIFFLGIFFVFLWWAVNNIVTIDSIEKPYQVTAEFEAASGVQPNAEVAYLGVHYGRVSDVQRETGGVKITMLIDRNKKDIPKMSMARIFRKSAIGEPYVDFEPPPGFDAAHASANDFLRAGDAIPRERTTIPLEFSELLRSAAALLEHIDPNQAGSLIHELSDALAGRADSLRQLTTAGDDLAAAFAQKTDVLDRLATNNTAITHVVAEHANDFGQSITNLRQIADALAASNGNTQVLLDQGSQLMGQLADLVDDEKGSIDCVLHDLTDVIGLTSDPNRLAGTAYLLENAPNAYGEVWSTRDIEPDGVWVRVNLESPVGQGTPAKQYVPPKSLPAVPQVAPCSSTLTSRGPDFQPSQVSTRSNTNPVVIPLATNVASSGGAEVIGIIGVVVLAAIALRKVSHAIEHRRS